MSAAAAISLFALLAISQAAPPVAHWPPRHELEAALEAMSPDVCINIPFGYGRAHVCPTGENCNRVSVQLWRNMNADFVACERLDGGKCMHDYAYSCIAVSTIYLFYLLK